MKKFNKILLVATAITLVTSSAAYAAGNSSHIKQVGNKNDALITQNGLTTPTAGHNNAFGLAGAGSAAQTGNQNDLDVTQDASDNSIGLVGAGVDQTGSWNELSVTQNSKGNNVKTIQQTNSASNNYAANAVAAAANGELNKATVTQKYAVVLAGTPTGGNVIDTITQLVTGGGNNELVATQDGSANEISSITQTNTGANGAAKNDISVSLTGSNNGTGAFAATFSGLAGPANSTLTQDGYDNLIQLSINNSTAANPSTGNKFGISQTGNSHRINTTGGVTITGDKNRLAISQLNGSGTSLIGNVVNISTISGDSNDIGIKQLWGDEEVTLTLSSMVNGNNLYIEQNLGNNDATITIGSSNNNTTLFTGDALSLGLTVGHILQTGGDGTVTITVDAASATNSFAVSQTGLNGTVTGIIDTGNNNQAAILQASNNATTSFTQSGEGNNIGVTQ